MRNTSRSIAALLSVSLAACSHGAGMLPTNVAASQRTMRSDAKSPYKFKVLESFTGDNGLEPLANLTTDKNGNFYGTTYSGFHRDGTLFKLDSAGKKLKTLYNFEQNLTGPGSDVLMDSQRNLYGTTYTGQGYTYEYGGVYKVNPQGVESVLYAFTNGSDGSEPFGNPIMDAQGNVYGTAYGGGSTQGSCTGSGCGVVFKVTTAGAFSVVHTFTYGDGAQPQGGVIMDSSGNLYGTTAFGGSAKYGTVYKISSGGKESVLYNFTNGQDGGEPVASLLLDASGNLYGTASTGGNKVAACANGPASGCGTVFKIDSSGHETTLHAFSSQPDGAQPYSALIMDGNGNLYGTAREGGKGQYNGTVFEVSSSGSAFSVLHSFIFNDGEEPQGSLYLDASGDLYGTTSVDGPGNGGTVYKLSPQTP
ncbi:MAG: hypothetical protein JOZ77_03360 [Candidatus Eremiobacteraeota bacterium]|nr:hypothetical protein [Candidatus Eremiobacteraeota bacterium]